MLTSTAKRTDKVTGKLRGDFPSQFSFLGESFFRVGYLGVRRKKVWPVTNLVESLSR